MKTDSERGVVGAWAYRARQEADLSPEQVADALAARGHFARAATIRGVESGSKKPGARLLRLLGEVYGSTPPGEQEPAVNEVALLREAVALQAEAIRDLVARVDHLLERLADEDRRTDERTAEMLAMVLATLRGSPEPDGESGADAEPDPRMGGR